MKTQITLACLCLYLTLTAQDVCGSFSRPADDTIVGRTKRSVLIVAGKVTDLQYVEPDPGDVEPGLGGYIYTDVTITVSKVLKGEPNIDENTVRFRVEGGIMKDGSAQWVSTVREFPIGNELILFIVKRSWRDWAYDKLYPMMHCYPEIVTEQKDGQTHKFVWFHLSFWEDEYSMKLPVELAFRLIENAIEAPEAVALLEEKIRAIEDIQGEKIRAIKDTQRKRYESESSTMFLSMLEWELTQIEARIKEKKNRHKPSPYIIDVQKLASAAPETADQRLKEMVPCKLMMECRTEERQDHSCVILTLCWEVGKGEVPDISLKLNSRTYQIENGQEGKKPQVKLHFDPLDHVDRDEVDAVFVIFNEYVSPIEAFRRLGYDPDKRIKHLRWNNGWYFITTRHVHQMLVEDRESGTEVAVYLRRLFD